MYLHERLLVSFTISQEEEEEESERKNNGCGKWVKIPWVKAFSMSDANL